MGKLSTRQDLIDYCLRRLGAPSLELNLDPDQIEDRIDDAFQFFYDYHFDGVQKVFLAHKLTHDDIAGNVPQSIPDPNDPNGISYVYGGMYSEPQGIPIPPPVISVTRVIPISASNRSMGMFDIQYQMRLNDLYTFTSTSIVHYDIMRKHLALLEFEFNVDPSIEFRRHQGRLFIQMDWQEAIIGQYIMIECYRILDPAQYSDIYNDRWLKSYTTELLRRQWGENMMKYNGVALLGGVSLNGGEIYQKALDNLDKLEQQVKDEFQLPCDFLLG